jgi:hypothetical protein
MVSIIQHSISNRAIPAQPVASEKLYSHPIQVGLSHDVFVRGATQEGGHNRVQQQPAILFGDQIQGRPKPFAQRLNAPQQSNSLASLVFGVVGIGALLTSIVAPAALLLKTPIVNSLVSKFSGLFVPK